MKKWIYILILGFLSCQSNEKEIQFYENYLKHKIDINETHNEKNRKENNVKNCFYINKLIPLVVSDQTVFKQHEISKIFVGVFSDTAYVKDEIEVFLLDKGKEIKVSNPFNFITSKHKGFHYLDFKVSYLQKGFKKILFYRYNYFVE